MTLTMPETIPENAPEIRAMLMGAGDELRGLHTARPDTSDATAVANWQRDIRTATDFIHLLDPILQAAERSAPQGGTAGTADFGGASEARSWGEQFVASDAYAARSDARTSEVNVRTLLTSSLTDPSAGLFMPVGTPRPPLQRQQRMFIRDLIAVVPTTLSSVPYIRELTPATYETGASSVAEGVAKPEATMKFEQADAPIRKIATWIPITTEIADDAPTLRGYIDSRLAYMLALREEQQILSGNGIAPDLRGIINTTNVQTQGFTSTDVLITLGLAIGKIENVDGEADGIAMNPTDYWQLVTTRSSTQFDVGVGNGSPFGSPPGTIWGLPVVRSRSVAADRALVGAFRLGATLFDREQTTIRTTDSHSTYFTENKLVILAEERVGLAVNRPDLFCYATIA